MPKGYWIAHVTVTDPDGYRAYVAANKAAFEKYGGRFLVRGGRCEAPAGGGNERHVVIAFDSYDTALTCYRSPEYQAALKLRMAASHGDTVIVEGVE